MNWLSKVPPGIKNIFKRDDNNPETLWTKCTGCGEMIFHRDLEAAHRVCPSCNHHMAIGVEERLSLIFDRGEFIKIELPSPATDPLKFKDEKKYADRLKDYRKRTGQNDALVVAAGEIEKNAAVVAVQNFKFMGGSMGMALSLIHI